MTETKTAPTGFDWGALEEISYGWGQFTALGLSWSGFEALTLDYPDPNTGYTWEDVQKAEFTWKIFTEGQLSWQEWQELIPGGNWEDSLAVSASEGEKIYLQVNAVNVSVTRGIIFTIAYDPSALLWEGKFSNHEIGLIVKEYQRPDVVSHENGELKLHFPTPQNNPWSGVVAGLTFGVKKTGTINIELK